MKTRAILNDIKIDFKTRKPLLTFLVQGEAERFEKYLDKPLDLNIEKHRERRSLDANALLWACLGELAKALGTDNWSMYLFELERYGKYTYIMCRTDAVDDLSRQWREIKIVGEEDGMTKLLCFFGSSTYNSAEMSHLIDGVISDMKDAGLDPPVTADIRIAIDSMSKTRKKH